ncbi:MAG TPA: pyridoxal phosphate-dependent aminotransferase [Anaerovoracaceae bacterium]|nr:pyridoxal phosphate-dependent aminotransferase [Anaerovoracaceae bacterium]
MISKKMQEAVQGSSVIRAMFEEGKKRKDLYGAENVFDFSLGNPNTPPPQEINQIIFDILQNEQPTFVHGYMSNAGYEDVRGAIAGSLNKRFHTAFGVQNILMTTGAAGGLNVILKTLLDPEDEVITFTPYFVEYRSYTENYNGKLVVVPPDTTNFQPNLSKFEELITNRTKAVIVNSPNNPTGVVYSEDTVKKMAEILRQAQKKFGTNIYLIADEPYRELVYDGVFVPYIPLYFENTIVAYSYSKSLSLPGERIGYLVIPDAAADFEDVLNGAVIANRILGYVNAPSLMQRAVAKCLDMEADIEGYNRNREALYQGLIEMGYECVKPQGAFYLFVKSPMESDKDFCEAAKKYNLLLVPGSAFACPGYVRIAYCVSYDTVIGSLPRFKELMLEIRKGV